MGEAVILCGFSGVGGAAGCVVLDCAVLCCTLLLLGASCECASCERDEM